MKEFLSQYFDLKSYDRWPLAGFFAVLLFGMVTDHIVDESSYFYVSIAYLVMIIVCVTYDARNLSDAGIDHPSRGWIILVPVYLWRRDTLAKKSNRRIFWAWLLLCVLSFANAWVAVGNDNTALVEQDVCTNLDTVDTLRENNISCVRAYDMKEQYDGYWKGKAHLSNDRDINVSADYNKQKGMVWVQIHSLLEE